MAEQTELSANAPLLPPNTQQAASAIGKLLFFSLLMFTLPFATFFATKYTLQGYFEITGFTNTIWSVMFSVINVNLIIVIYAYIAYLEPDYDDKGNIIIEQKDKKQQ